MKKIALIFSLILTSSTALFAGGPWTLQKGKGYYKLSEWWVVFDKHYTDIGKTDPNVTTGIFNTSLYAEYGLTDRFTGILNGPIVSRNYMNNLVSEVNGATLAEGDEVNSLGDIDVALKYGITKPGSKIAVSATLTLGLPTGKSVAGKADNLQTGDGEFNQMITIDAGTSFNFGGKVDGYTSAYTGFNNRTKDFSEELRYGIEGGLGFFKSRLWVIGRLTAVESLKNGATAETATINSTSIFANNSENTSFGVEAAVYLTKRWGVSASYATAFRGEIIAAAPSYSVGVFLDMTR